MLVLVTASLTPSSVGDPWPMFGHDPQHTGQSQFIGPQTNALKWTFPISRGDIRGIAIGADETIYATAADNRLYAIDRNGSLKWSFLTGAIIISTPAIAFDGTIYVASEDGNFYAVNPDGTLRWVLPIGIVIDSSPVTASDGTIYVGNINGELVAISADGVQQWRFTIGGQVLSSPTIGSDGTIYVMARILPSSPQNGLYAIHPDGSLKWHFPTNPSGTSPAIGTDGTIYITDEPPGLASVPVATNNLYAVNPDGSLKWSFNPSEDFNVLSSPAIGSDSTIYVGSLFNILSATHPNGTLKWDYITQIRAGSSPASPAIGADGTIYIGGPPGTSDINRVFAINPDGSTKWIAIANDFIVPNLVIGSTRTLYVAADNSQHTAGTLYAFGPRPVSFACPLGQGFWNTHPDAWPVASLTLGSQTYSQTELLALLNTPVRGDGSLILADQLIAAKLNIANGADPTPISATITDADHLLSGFTGKLPYGVPPSSATGQAMVDDATVLESYNNGELTPECTP
jgi:outer membrane protein assembly factor BamB